MDLVLWLFVLVVVCSATCFIWFLWSDFADALALSELRAASPEELGVINSTAGHWVL